MSDTSWEQFIEMSRRNMEQTERELKEVDMLIQQTSSEVDRLMQRNSRAVARARQVEGVFDTVPREDIKSAYNTLIENQQRLFTMRGQLEKLQSDQKNLERLHNLLQEIQEYVAPKQSADQQTASPSGDSATQAMVISIIEAQEQERLRLSRQMHDGPAQSLTNLVLQAEICERLFDRDPDRARTELAELKKNVINTFQKVKNFIFDLRPMMLDDLGLMPTMKRYVEGISESGYTGLSLNVTGKDRRLAAHKEVTVFRVVQALIHVGREQSQATNMTISLDISDSQVRVIYEDNGRGLDIDDSLTTPDANRLNLPTLRERIEMINGTISFSGNMGQGLRVSFTLPAEPGEE